MSHISIEKRGVNAKFLKGSDDQILIEFNDPTYAKAENVLFNPQTNEVIAVLHEGMFSIGHVPKEFMKNIKDHGQIALCADHYSGNRVTLNATVSVLKH